MVNFGVGLMTVEQVGQWVGVRGFLEAGTEMYLPFADESETPNATLTGTEFVHAENAEQVRLDRRSAERASA